MKIKNKSFAVGAKARSMYGHRLTEVHYNEMLKKANVAEIALYLKENTYYGQSMNGLDFNNINRTQLEHRISEIRYKQYMSLLRFADVEHNPYFAFLFLWEEIDQILGVLRHLSSSSEEPYFFHYSKSLPKYASYDVKSLVVASDYEQVLDVLKATPYKKIIEKYIAELESKEDNRQLVDCERNLKIQYYEKIFAMVNNFDNNQKKELTNLFMHQIDIENIVSAYRLKHFFNTEADVVLKTILPYNTTSQKLITEIANAKTQQELKDIMMKSPLFKGLEMDNDYVENLTFRLRERHCRKLIRCTCHGATVLTCYVGLLEVEIENVINIVEAIRYGLPPATTKKLLINSNS